MDDEGVRHLLTYVQDGVVARRQLIELGADDAFIRRLVRRRELSVVYPGVYVEHTGRLSWEQRAWAAVLACWPAALTRESALANPPRGPVVHVAVDRRRTVRPVTGVVVHRTADLHARVDPSAAPPRVRLEHAVLDVASTHLHRGDVLTAFRVLAEACATRRTRPDDVARVLAGRSRIFGRAKLADLLDDLATGAWSVLEREYLNSVERAHGLPPGTRQARSTAGGRTAFRDVLYESYDVIVELDGRAFHDDTRSRDADHERDLVAAAVERRTTLRLTYGQVFGNPCRTAGLVATVLQGRGWLGRTASCAHCAGQGRDSQSPGDCE